MTIKKIFDGIFDEEVHSDFLKFGKGEFRNKYLVDAKKQGDKWAIKTGPEFANYLVKMGLEKCNEKIKASGIIVSTFDLREPLGGYVFNPKEEIKQFMGIKQLKVNSEIDPKKAIEIMNKFPRAFFALSFSLPDYELKIKAKAPKSAKPSTRGEKEIKADFCTLKTTDKKIIDEILFGVSDFKEISVKHIIIIEQIVYPKDFAKMKPEEVREISKRKGKIIRNIVIDGKSQNSSADFEA